MTVLGVGPSLGIPLFAHAKAGEGRERECKVIMHGTVHFPPPPPLPKGRPHSGPNPLTTRNPFP